MFIWLTNFLQNQSTVNFGKVSTFSKFASFYEEPTWCDVIILDEIVFLKIRFLIINIFTDKFLASIVFDTICSLHHIY